MPNLSLKQQLMNGWWSIIFPYDYGTKISQGEFMSQEI